MMAHSWRTTRSNGRRLESASFSHGLSHVASRVDTERASLHHMLHTAQHLLHHSDLAVRSFSLLRSRFPHLPGADSLAPGQADIYRGVPCLPSPFLIDTVARFEVKVTEYRHKLTELQAAIEPALADSRFGVGYSRAASAASAAAAVEALPVIIKNLHDFFIHVAAQVERVHERVDAARNAFLAERRRRGDRSNPFAEADRIEAAATASKKPSLLGSAAGVGTGAAGGAAGAAGAGGTGSGILSSPLSLLPGTTTPGASPNPTGLFPSSTSTTPSLFGSTTPATATTPGLSLFGTPPASAVAGSSPGTSLFGTPTPSLFGSATPGAAAAAAASSPGLSFGNPATPATGTTSLFGAPNPAAAGSSPGSSLFGNTSAFGTGASAFGATPGAAGAAASTPSLFGSPAGPTTGGLFGATPAAASPFGAPAASPFGAAGGPSPSPFGAAASAPGTWLFGAPAGGAAAGSGGLFDHYPFKVAGLLQKTLRGH
ncbi:unnamed protein product [Closterium sp. NIES-64]|nr:unnamed protein product [Closterium sp. NIES-64]